MEKTTFLFIFVLITSVLGSTALVLKLNLDLVSDNSLFINFLKILHPIVSDVMCEHLCSRETGKRTNLRKFTPKGGLCECMEASEDFFDNRETADKLDESVLLIDRCMYRVCF